IRRKYNNLQTDLINEQQRRYNAEAERDIRQAELTQTQGDLNLITTAYNNERVVCHQYFLELQQCRIRIDMLENDLHLCDIQLDLKWDQNSDQTQSKKKSFTKQNDNVQSSQPASNILQSTVSQATLPSYDEMQKSFQAMFDKQDTKHKAEMEKLKAEFQAQMTQQPIAQKEQTLVPQIVKPARQPKGPPSNLITKEDYETYYLGKYFNDLGIYSKEDLDSNYPEKPFQRSRPQRKDNSVRLEEKVDEIGNMLSNLNINNQSKKPVAKSNRTQRYYPFQSINYNFSANNENSGYNEENDIWYDDDSEKKNEYQ
ncbi:7703_t:CDS:2, partial [Paraglomus brasilianum]